MLSKKEAQRLSARYGAMHWKVVALESAHKKYNYYIQSEEYIKLKQTLRCVSIGPFPVKI